jgi:serine/threonine-protein kinase HipA
MEECRLLEEGGRRHFMTRRFDRDTVGRKRHMQSLGALAHYDFNQAGACSYEQAFQAIRALGLSMDAGEQQFRRMTFNIVARNQDDHVKNIAFLMNRAGGWELAPAYDVTYAYRPSGRWTNVHQMSLDGKRDNFTREDFRQCAAAISMKQGRADTILAEVIAAVTRWPEHAAAAGVADEQSAQIQRTHRLDFPAG